MTRSHGGSVNLAHPHSWATKPTLMDAAQRDLKRLTAIELLCDINKTFKPLKLCDILEPESLECRENHSHGPCRIDPWQW
ncbi:hypothetical protein KCU83_g115, partial [Aureobasidium melanogenum]